MRVLFAGSDERWMRPAADVLQARGARVTQVADAAAAEAALAVDGCDLLVLDLAAVAGSVAAALAGLRSRHRSVPILALAACSTVQGRVRAMEAGADDCLSRPLSLDELLVRVQVWNRRRFGSGLAVIERGRLRFDVTHRAATVDGEALPLSRLEIGLLESLLSRPGRPLSKDQLLAEMAETVRAPRLNTIEVQISRLRKKLQPAQVGIASVRGVGYRLEAVGSGTH